MNFLKKIIVFTFFCFAFSSCGNDYDQQAKNICDCVNPLLEINSEMQSLLKSKRQDEFEKLIPKAGELQKEAIECSKKGFSGEVDKEALKKALENNTCEMNQRMIDAIVNGI